MDAETELDAVTLENRGESVADLGALAICEPVGALDDRHARSEARQKLAELDRDDTAADSHHALGNLRQVGRLAIRPVAGFCQPRDRRHDGFGAGRDDGRLRLEQLGARFDPARACDATGFLDDVNAPLLVPGDTLCVVMAGDHVVAVGGETREVERRRADSGRRLALALDLGRAQERLRGDATPVRTLAAEHGVLDQRDALARP